MANANRVVLVGRLTRDVETRMAGEVKVANIGFVTNNRKKNQQTGNWDDDPCFIDVTLFGQLAINAEKYLQKGSSVYLEGRLTLDRWKDKDTGNERSKLKVIADTLQFLDKRQDGGGNDGGGYQGNGNGYGNNNYAGSNSGYGGQTSGDIPY